MNAAERFVAASRAHDVEAAAAELAEGVVMLNPATESPTIGRDAVTAALQAVEAACDQFRHTHLLSEQDSGGVPLFAAVFEAKVGDETLRGVDLLELDEHDRIRSFAVMARPMSAVMALGRRMSEGHR